MGLAKLKALRGRLGFSDTKVDIESLLVQNSGEDGETSQQEWHHDQNSALGWKTCHGNHLDWNSDQSEVGCEVEDHLYNRIVLVSCALKILYRHSPVLVKWAANANVVNNHDRGIS